MHLSWFAAVLLIMFAFCAFGLKCNYCSSSISFEDCIKQQHEIVCDKGYQCGKFHYEYKKQKDIYSLSCSRIMHCNDPAYMCRLSTNRSDCEVTCCDTDLCNSASSHPIFIGLVVFACLLTKFSDGYLIS